MDLTYDEIERYLSLVFLGKKYECIDNNFLIFKYPSHDIKQKADHVYLKALDSAISEGVLPAAQLRSLIEKRNLITTEDKAAIKKLSSQLEAQEILLSKTTRVKANQERIKENIYRIKNNIHKLESKEASIMTLSAEMKAEEDKTFYICSMCVFKENGELVWPTFEDALKERNIQYKDEVMIKFLKFYSGLSVAIIRALARSNLWRIRYVNSMKTSDPLFGIPTSEYTIDQLNIVYWSNYYQNIYEMMPEDRPSDIVIDDDDALDAYMKTFYEERNRQDAERRHKNKRSGKLSAFDSEEVIVTKAHELYEDIDYDTPREAQRIKDRSDIRKKAKRR